MNTKELHPGLGSGALREVLAKHEFEQYYLRCGCSCGWGTTLAESKSHWTLWAKHFADVLALSLSSPIEPQDPAEMREEADIHSGYATPRWLVYFDDLDRGPIAFHTEVEARKFYEDSKVAWSCHLFVLVPSRPTSQASSEVRELLLRHGFVRVFCGFDGEFYYACKQCNAYSPGHNHVEVTPELAKHNEDCKLNALLAPSRQGAGGK